MRKELIEAMDSRNQMKKTIKVLMDELMAKKLLMEQKYEQLQAVRRKASKAEDEVGQALQQTDEYNGVLLGWYFKGFEPLRRYLAKHNPGMDLDNLDLKAVEKEMEAEEATAGNAANEGANDGGDNQTV